MSVIEDQQLLDGKQEPDFDHLLIAQLINQMIQLVQIHFQSCVVNQLISSRH
jgi:hypothetical protein